MCHRRNTRMDEMLATLTGQGKFHWSLGLMVLFCKMQCKNACIIYSDTSASASQQPCLNVFVSFEVPVFATSSLRSPPLFCSVTIPLGRMRWMDFVLSCAELRSYCSILRSFLLMDSNHMGHELKSDRGVCITKKKKKNPTKKTDVAQRILPGAPDVCQSWEQSRFSWFNLPYIMDT